jgi:uncharacterized protein (TIGR02246 family)
MKLELKKIREQRQNWIDAINDNDLELVAGYLSSDAVWMPSNMPALNGKNAIAEWMKPSFENFDHEFTIENLRIRGAGNWAFEQANFVSRLTPKEGGDPTENEGSYVIIWRWEDDNQWRIERYVDNSEVLEPA